MINDRALKSILIKSGYNVEWLATQMGYTPQNLYSKLRGRTTITLDEVNRIRHILNLNDGETKEIFFAQ